MVFAVFDHDSLVEALQSVWDQIAPTAMFTAAGNIGASRYSENFQNALDMIKWNQKVTEYQQGVFDKDDTHALNGTDRAGYGFSYGADAAGDYTNPINSQTASGSNNSYDPSTGLWKESENQINVPAGFTPIRGGDVIYADTLPPFDITLTFASEYGNTAFQKIYDVDILNESSGASVDTVVMSRQVTWIARRLSPLIRGVYQRDENGIMNPLGVNEV